MAKRPAKASPQTGAAGKVRAYISGLKPPSAAGHVVTAMVKPATGGNGLLIAHFGRCGHWAHIPAEAIAAIRDNGQTRCGAHIHPVADIEFKKPTAGLAQAYAALADLHVAKLDTLGGGDAFQCAPGQHWGKDSSGNWGCQPGP